VNYLAFPTGTPVNFEITSDAPMNSFWIPQLGGQIYAMAGMSTQLHLIADQPGDYRGSSANLSGAGFSGMNFTAHATANQAEFEQWVATVKSSPYTLDQAAYSRLAQPSQNDPAAYYSSEDAGLYGTVMTKYLGSSHVHTDY